MPTHDVCYLEQLVFFGSRYSSASVTDEDGQTYKLDPGLTLLLQTSRDYDKLKWAWDAWRDASGKLMKNLYNESVYLQNESVKPSGESNFDSIYRIAPNCSSHPLWDLML